MKLFKITVICFTGLMLFGCSEHDKTFPPNQYPMFTHKTIVERNGPGFERKILPINNSYNNNPGCYLACYSHNPKAAYSVTSTIFVEGLVRIKGTYDGINCRPYGVHEGIDISALQKFKAVLNDKEKSKDPGTMAKYQDNLRRMSEAWDGIDVGTANQTTATSNFTF